MHWLAIVSEILRSNIGDLRELAQRMGGDPRSFYIGVDLSKTDLRGQDLRGMNFTGSNLEDAVIDSDTFIEPQFDPRRSTTERQLYIYVGPALLSLLEKYRNRLGLSSIKESIVDLLGSTTYYLTTGAADIETWARIIWSSGEIRNIFQEHYGKRLQLGVTSDVHRQAQILDDRFSGPNAGFTALMIIGLLRWAQVTPDSNAADVADLIYDRIGDENDAIPKRAVGPKEEYTWHGPLHHGVPPKEHDDDDDDDDDADDPA